MQNLYNFPSLPPFPFSTTSKSRHPTPRNSQRKCQRSLPKNGSSFPLPSRAHIHGAPKAPCASAVCVFAVSASFHRCAVAPAMISLTCVAEKSFVAASTEARIGACVMFWCGDVHIASKSASQACASVEDGWWCLM